jgi:transcriptional regulator with XRE-family HTH domain
MAQKKKSLVPPGMGDRIKAIRKSRGWSQERFADTLGISQSSLSLVELGNVPLPFEGLYNLAYNFRDVDMREVICGKTTNILINKSEQNKLRIDTKLLRQVILGIEKILEKDDLKIPADKKAKLIDLLYWHFSQTGGEAYLETIRKYLQLII